VQTAFVYQDNDPGNGTCPTGTCQATQFGYDGYGRLQTRRRPVETSDSVFAYNNDDTLYTVTDPRGKTATYTYNGRRLVTTVNFGGANNTATSTTTAVPAAANLTFLYDQAGNRTKMTETRTLPNNSQVSDYVDYGYDTLHRMQSETRYFYGLSASFQLNYTYNPARQLMSLESKSVAGTYTDKVVYGRDKTGRLATVAGAPSIGGVGSMITGMSYRAWGSASSVSYASGGQTSLQYNARTQLTSYAGIANYSYTDDGKLQRVTAINASQNNLNATFAHDSFGRMTNAYGDLLSGGTNNSINIRPYDQSYSFDVFDNMNLRGGNYWWQSSLLGGSPKNFQTTYVNGRAKYNNINGKISENGVLRNWLYDAAGNVMVDYADQATADYDIRSDFNTAGQMAVQRIKKYDTGGGTCTQTSDFDYDGDGRLLNRRMTPTSYCGSTPVENEYLVNSTVLGGKLITMLNASGQKKATYIYAEGTILARQEPTTPNGNDGLNFDNRDPMNVLDGGSGIDPLGAKISPVDWNALQNQINSLRTYYENLSRNAKQDYGNSSSDAQRMGACYENSLPVPCEIVLKRATYALDKKGDNGTSGLRNPETSTTTVGNNDNLRVTDSAGKVWYDFDFRLQAARPLLSSDLGLQDGLQGGGQQGGGQQVNRSDCGLFVDELMESITTDYMTDEVLTLEGIGRGLALRAWGTLRERALAGTLGVDGFQERYIAGGQNGFALVHVAGVAGVTLIGNSYLNPLKPSMGTGYERANAQLREDSDQLEEGLRLQRAGRTTIDYSGNPSYPLNRYIAEKHAERWGTGAGATVGNILRDTFIGRRRKQDARNDIFNLLCDR
jgi:YD repeat-containing protein